MVKLPAKRERFCQEYVKDLNGTQAAIRAGYKVNSANEQAAQLLAILSVKERVAQLQEKIATKCGLTAERVLREIELLAFTNMGDFLKPDENGQLRADFRDKTRDQMAAVHEYTVDLSGGGAGDGERKAVERVRFKLTDKVKSLELAARHLKLLTDKVELSADESVFSAAAQLARTRKK